MRTHTRLSIVGRAGGLLLALLLALLGFAPTATQAAATPVPKVISAGLAHTCVLTPSGAADCWGINGFGRADDQAGPYAQISAGGFHTCALTPSGAADCWGNNDSGQSEDPAGPYTQ